MLIIIKMLAELNVISPPAVDIWLSNPIIHCIFFHNVWIGCLFVFKILAFKNIGQQCLTLFVASR